MKVKNETAIQYLIGTFLLSYISWGIMIAASRIEALQYGTPCGMILFLMGGYSPTIVACICLMRHKEVTGFKQIIKDCFTFRQNPMIYILLVGFLLLAYIVHILAGQIVVLEPFYMAIVMIPAMMFGGGLEEVGWRYLLQPVLERRFPFALSTMIMGVIWALWHLPLFLIAGTNQNLYMSYPVFAVGIFGTAFILAFLRNYSKGIWPCILFHSTVNALAASYAIQEKMLFTVITTVLEIVAVFLLNCVLKNRKEA